MRTIASAIVMTSALVTSLSATEPEGPDRLVGLYYRFEVAAVYCGVMNESATQGYYLARRNIVKDFDLDEVEQLNASGKASQMANAEWQNRGLGGFKRWCRNEGTQYAAEFQRIWQKGHGSEQ
jgi:hypothetical protein